MCKKLTIDDTWLKYKIDMAAKVAAAKVIGFLSGSSWRNWDQLFAESLEGVPVIVQGEMEKLRVELKYRLGEYVQIVSEEEAAEE